MASEAGWVMSGASNPSVNSFLHHDHRLRLGHGGLVDEWMELALLYPLIYDFLRPHSIHSRLPFNHSVPIIQFIQDKHNKLIITGL